KKSMDHGSIADSEWEQIHLPGIKDTPNRPNPPPLQKTVDPHVSEVQHLLFHEPWNPTLEDLEHNMDPRLANVKRGVWKWDDGNHLDNRGNLRWKSDLEIVDSSSDDMEVEIRLYLPDGDIGNLGYTERRVGPQPAVSSATAVQITGQGVNEEVDEQQGLVPREQASPPTPGLTTGEPSPLVANPENTHPPAVAATTQDNRAATIGEDTDTEALDPDFTWADYDELMAVRNDLHLFVNEGGTFDDCGQEYKGDPESHPFASTSESIAFVKEQIKGTHF
ncbi:MAG: hypothetical protein Q9181_005286, partial [Wetmoreana brouardii]